MQIRNDSTIAPVAERGIIGGVDPNMVWYSVDSQNYKNHLATSTMTSAAIVSSHNLILRGFVLSTDSISLF
ncbi:MAG: hypothetical protein ABIN36_12545 [Ferruginibacter sp.]